MKALAAWVLRVTGLDGRRMSRSGRRYVALGVFMVLGNGAVLIINATRGQDSLLWVSVTGFCCGALSIFNGLFTWRRA